MKGSVSPTRDFGDFGTGIYSTYKALPAVAPPAVVSRFPLTIADDASTPTAAASAASRSTSAALGPLVDALHALQRLLRQFAVPLALVKRGEAGGVWAGLGRGLGLRRAPGHGPALRPGQPAGGVALLLRPGQRYRGEGGVEAAAVRIQARWRGCRARAAYLRHRRRRWAAGVLAGCLLRVAIPARSPHLDCNQPCYTKSQRLHLKDFDILQNAQIGRLADVRDENVDVIYVSPRPLGEDMVGYYARLLEFQGPVRGTEGDSGSTHHNRFTIVTPEALDYFPSPQDQSFVRMLFAECYTKRQRLHLKDFDILQNAQIGRLADVRDENVDVIYVSPRPLGEDMAGYYARLLEFQGPVRGTEGDSGSTHHNRFTIVTPEALDYFPTHSMCLSTLLKYSPRALRRIRALVQGRRAYAVGGVAHPDDLAVADQLGVAVLGPEPAVARPYGTKSGGRRIFAGAGVAVPPGHGDIYSLDQLHETLAGLMAQNMEVRRWLFKMDSEFGGRGTAYCDVGHLSCHGLALQEYQRLGPELWSRELEYEDAAAATNTTSTHTHTHTHTAADMTGIPSGEHVVHKYAEEIPAWLACYAQPAHASCFPDWACFLETFLRQGQTPIAVSVLSYGDQLHGACRLQTLGSRVPQASVRPDALRALCLPGIVGHVSVDLATFPDPSTGRQKVWAIDLDLGYSDQLAMTQLLLVVTGATLDCRSCRLLVPVPTQEKSPEAETQQSPAK
ncbi:hypothetical protein CRUP_022488, partial [Coryphaenoides rupestris]